MAKERQYNQHTVWLLKNQTQEIKDTGQCISSFCRLAVQRELCRLAEEQKKEWFVRS